MTNIPPQMYGVWTPRKGWLKAVDLEGHPQAYAEIRKDVARATANRIGNHSRVEYIDQSLVALEQELLNAEKIPMLMIMEDRLCLILQTFKDKFKRK